MADENLKRQAIDIAFKANGAALTLSLVAASNLLKGTGFEPISLVPSWLFFGGLGFAYLLFTVSATIDVHFMNLNTTLTIRDTILKADTIEHPSNEMRAIADQARLDLTALNSRLLSKKKIEELVKLSNWVMNGSMLCFALGVAWSLIALSLR